ncbi:uncharacterized protein [Musca autumnalis]|uniref:uncharacterized protein n=1 Tax=Musca autumnalis TaxID=221902 RepID=UPI003CF85BAF
MKLLLPFSTFLLHLAGTILTEPLAQVLQKFQQNFDIHTLVVFGGNGTFDFWDNYPEIIQQPRVIIRHEVAHALRESQGDRILSFINLDTNDMDYLEEILKPSLLFLHLRDILFYTNTTWSPERGEEWLWLFEWLWEQGFWRVLLMNEADQYLAMDCIPKMQMKSLTLESYFQMRKQKYLDLQGVAFRTALGNNPPRANAYFDEDGQLQVSGFYGNTLTAFAHAYNATLEYVLMPNMSSYSVLDCMQSLRDHEADICADAILFGTGIETTRPFYIVVSTLMVPYDAPLEKYKYFSMSFTGQVWLVIGITFLCTLALLVIVEYKEYRRLSLIDNFFTTFSSFLCASWSLEHFSQNYRYGLETILIFSGFMLSNYYLSVLSALLLTKIYTREINSLEDVVERNLSILTTEFQQWILEVTNATPLMRQQTVVVDEEFVVKNKRLLNPEHIYFGLDEELNFFLYQQKFLSRPRMKKLEGEAITTDIGEIPMRSYWPFQEILESFCNNLFDSGVYAYIDEGTYQESIHLKHIAFIPNEDLSVEPLTLEYFVICGLILAVAYVVGLMCFVIEIFVYKKIESPLEIVEKFYEEFDIYTLLIFANNGTRGILQDFQQPQLVIGGEGGEDDSGVNETLFSDLRRTQGERVLSFISLGGIELSYLEEVFKPTLLNLHLANVIFYSNASWLEGVGEDEAIDEWQWLFEWCWQQGFWHVILVGSGEKQQYLSMESIPEMQIKAVTLVQYFAMRRHRIVNLQGYPVRVAVGNNPPRVVAFFDEEENLQLGGFYGNTILMFGEAYNSTLDHLVVPFDRPLENYNYFRMPFTEEVWILIAITFLCTLVLLMLVEYKEYGELRLINSLFTTFQSMICSGFSVEHFSQYYHYGVESILIFSGFMLSNFYLAVLSALLLTKIYKHEIDSIADVIRHNLTIVTTEFQQYVLEVTDAPQEIRRQTIVLSEKEAVANMRQLNPEYKFLSRPRMKKLDQEAVTTDIGEVPMRSYWPLRDHLTSFMENMFSVEPLSLEYFVMCGLILAGGYALSLICFIIELIVFEKLERK